MSIDIPSRDELIHLAQHRDEACVSIYVAAEGTAITHNVDAAQTKLRSLLSDALDSLKAADISHADRTAVAQHVNEVLDERLAWATRARSLAVFATPENLHVYQLMNRLQSAVTTGTGFDIGQLVRAVTFDHTGYVLALTEGEVRLLRLMADATHERIELTELPEDTADVLSRDPATGRFNRHRADGTLGPKVEQRKYASIVQTAVLAAIGEADAPLVLAAANDLDPAYREVNTYSALLERGVAGNPASMSDDDLAVRGREILEEHHASQLADWVGDLGTREAHGRATTQLSDIARAAVAGQVDQLVFDLEYAAEGTIDEFGVISITDEPSIATQRIIDSLAALVLRNGGTVRAVRGSDLPGDQPAAATLRGQ